MKCLFSLGFLYTQFQGKITKAPRTVSTILLEHLKSKTNKFGSNLLQHINLWGTCGIKF